MKLLDTLPMREDFSYEMHESIAAVTEDQMASAAAKALHPVSLAFGIGSAAKEPSKHVVLQLSEEILKDGRVRNVGNDVR